MSTSPHVYQRIAETLTKLDTDVTADDVEFIVNGVGRQLDQEEAKRWYSFDLETRVVIWMVAGSHGVEPKGEYPMDRAA